MKCQGCESLYLWSFQPITKVLLTYYLSVFGVSKIEKGNYSLFRYYTSIILIYSKTHKTSNVSISGITMGIITVKTIPSRKWKDKKDRWELVVERDKNRKRNQQVVDERIHYMWINYLQLCINLEEINYSVPKRGGRGKVISTTKVKVSKSIYRKWDLVNLKKSSFIKL